MKFLSWNVNGYRAVLGKGFQDWFQSENADVIGLQEVKAFEAQVDPASVNIPGYHVYWNAAKKPGYSGTAVWTKVKPLEYQPGLGISEFDDEGRIQVLKFQKFDYLNIYFPNSQDERARLDYKIRFCEAVQKHCEKQMSEGRGVIVCGDYNVAHTEIDIKNAKSNQDSPGFYIEERDWMTRFLSSGMRDVFREKHPNETGHYSWWSYRANARANNVGWRIDYHCVSTDLVEKVKDVFHQPKILGSDHCPVGLIADL